MSEAWARLRDLLRSRAIVRGEVVLVSGQRSSYYIDARQVTLSPEGAFLAGRLLYARLLPRNVDAVGGPAAAAIPLATAVSLISHLEGRGIPAFFTRKEAKTHGLQRRVEGPLQAGWRVAIVEDTVTTGGSVLESIEAVEAAGCTVAHVVALVDRGQGCRERLEAAGYSFEALFSVEELLRS